MAELSREANLRQVAPPAFPVSGEAVAERLSRFRCVGCGYGASCRIAPERCPMCSGKTWEYDEPQRSADLPAVTARSRTLDTLEIKEDAMPGKSSLLFSETLDEESAADKLLTKIATGGLLKSGVNQAAAR